MVTLTENELRILRALNQHARWLTIAEVSALLSELKSTEDADLASIESTLRYLCSREFATIRSHLRHPREYSITTLGEGVLLDHARR